jgi:RNA polymerase sigma factor (sigma-70 family)
VDDYAAMSAEELMQRYYGCDSLAFGELHRRCSGELAAVAYRRLPRMPGRREGAEELAADALIRAAATKGRPSARWEEARGSVRTWLYTILHNTASTFLRRQHGIELTSTDLASGADSAEEQRLASLLADDDLGALDRLLQEELEAALEVCLDELPVELRTVLGMFRDGLIQTEIARILGISDATVMRYRLRAYALLAECLRRRNVAD